MYGSLKLAIFMTCPLVNIVFCTEFDSEDFVVLWLTGSDSRHAFLSGQVPPTWAT